MNNRLLLAAFIALVVVVFLSVVVIPNYVNLHREDITRANCRTLRNAVEDFAIMNDGVYPETVDSSRLYSNEILIDLLPGGKMFTNPFRGNITSPFNGMAKDCGEIGYQPEITNGVVTGYTITAVGRIQGKVMVTMTDHDSR